MSTVMSPRTSVIPVARPFVGEQEELGVLEVLRSGWLTQGTKVATFETMFAAYVGCEHAIAVSSCTTALQLALWVCGVGPGDEVICPSFSFIATANSIAYLGARPLFADIDLRTYNIDPEAVEALISPRTKAILVVHQIGLPADMKSLRTLADRYGLRLIEDAACAIGAEYEGKRIGTPIGDLACFSFHPRKILTTGEGGMITTRDAAMADRLSKLRQHAMSVSDSARHQSKRVMTETYGEIGFNYRMTDLQAAVGIAQLGRLSEMLERRRSLAERYTGAFKGVSWLQTPHVPEECRHNYQSYMVRLLGDAVGRRAEIMQTLLEKNISTRRAVMAIHREPPYLSTDWEGLLPRTCIASDGGIILPLFHQMTEEEQSYVIEAFLESSI